MTRERRRARRGGAKSDGRDCNAPDARDFFAKDPNLRPMRNLWAEGYNPSMSVLTETPAGETLRIQELMECVYHQALRLLDEWIGVEWAAVAGEDTGPPVRRPLVSVFPIEGSVEGRITLRAEEEAVRALMRAMIGEPGPEEDHGPLLRETVAEVLNIVIGNSTLPLRQRGLPINVFPPYAEGCGAEDGRGEEPDYQRRIDTAAGPMILSFARNGR